MIDIQPTTEYGQIPQAPSVKVRLRGDSTAYPLLGVDWYNYRIMIERESVEWVPMSIAVIEPKTSVTARKGDL